MIKLAVLPSLFGASLLATTSAQACAPDGAVELTSSQEAPFQTYAVLGLETISKPFEIDLYFCGDGIEKIDRIKVDAIMPAHQHGMNYTPEISGIEPGIFQVLGMFFHMPGMWELQVSTHSTSETNAQSYLFTLDISAR
ncbi:MAG: hypothetical protein JJ858_08415 [Rhizobiaceae bacterium]|nr:hypothetical protein [Rhizobiaceae bacterium]